MCGIAGYYVAETGAGAPPVQREIVARMRDVLHHRGPDASGIHVEPQIGLGFQRLSILDLSPAGNQPMASADGQCVIVFNGEIYNFVELRAELEAKGHAFRSQTDTEVILASYLEYGTDCVRRFNGMWAFALWDRRKRTLFCSRDRFGVKPFYYRWDGRTFVFGSEIKALLQHPAVPAAENRARVADYLATGRLDEDHQTLFDGIVQLEPGQSLTVHERKLVVQRHWTPPADVDESWDWERAVERYRELLIDAVKLRLRSDVQQGLLLSGGQDSSAIAGVVSHLTGSGSLSQREALKSGKLVSFSGMLADEGLDESQYAEAVIREHGLDAVRVVPDTDEIVASFERVLWANDEPLTTSNSLMHSLLLSRVHDRGIKVLLSGQGADEVLAGYDRHIVGPLVHDLVLAGRVTDACREFSSLRRRTGLPLHFLALQVARSFAPDRVGEFAKRVFWQKLGQHLTADAWLASANAGTATAAASGGFWAPKFKQSLRNNIQRKTLPKIVHYEDRGSMLHSVEERFPFLDYRLVEFTLSLPH
ncbi:MAG TPA: asparagine synthase (glutamine-hydrolyzing), partial [Burkholderiaceae bacterium]|nr:asparagine synthase (glutamine-hydrolyzing) [Burkholderiaceae bacterium]